MNQQIVDATTMALIQQSRDANCADTTAKALACAYLDIKVAALANEGFAIFSPHREAALSALRRARDAAALAQDVPSWTIVSNRTATVDTLNSIGALSVFPSASEPASFEYLGFFPATT